MDTQTFTVPASHVADENANSDGTARRGAPTSARAALALNCTIMRSALLTAAVMSVSLSGPVWAQTSESGSLSPVDYAFIGQTNLGNGF
jgi:hypothetical protein